jgi:predicted Zn finger-like uncharacterized protein
MRLYCPKCDAEYEVPDGMVPAAGRHVQCTVCHTRWFARGSAAPAPSEEQILTRLEARAPRPADAGGGGDELAGEPAAAAPVVPLRRPAASTQSAPARPAKPADRPAVTRPASITATRPAPRLELDAAPASPPASPPPAPRGRFGLGLVAAVLLFLLALGLYDFRQEIAAEIPEAGPTLDAYADTVDDLRDQVERQLAPLRDRIDELAG